MRNVKSCAPLARIRGGLEKMVEVSVMRFGPYDGEGRFIGDPVQACRGPEVVEVPERALKAAIEGLRAQQRKARRAVLKAVLGPLAVFVGCLAGLSAFAGSDPVSATEALRSRADGMSCAGSETDRYGRTIGVCSSGGEDLNAWLVANGWALAYRQYADDYVDEEAGARSNGRGIHRGAFVAPWDWRRGGRLGGADTFSWVASAPLDAGALADRLLSGDERGFDGQLLDESVFGIAKGVLAATAAGLDPAGSGAGWGGAR